jgi:protein-S-isoprenylcysteine O-methyltransferase Ste14
MSILIRAVVYATAFVGLLLIFVPSQILAQAGIARPAAIGAPQIVGWVIGALGAALTGWCIVTFVFTGKGTPAPFDPPGSLVVTGPYRYMRNPLYFGAALAMSGAALYYQSVQLLPYASAFLLFFHFFVMWYEVPMLHQTFGVEYASYRSQVGRWGPRPSPRTRGRSRHTSGPAVAATRLWRGKLRRRRYAALAGQAPPSTSLPRHSGGAAAAGLR